MHFTRQDLYAYIGITKSRSTFIKYRKYNLGYEKMGEYRTRNAHTKAPTTAMLSLVFFNPDEIIEYFSDLKKEYLRDPLKHARPLYLKAWDEAIAVAQYFKGKQ